MSWLAMNDVILSVLDVLYKDQREHFRSILYKRRSFGLIYA